MLLLYRIFFRQSLDLGLCRFLELKLLFVKDKEEFRLFLGWNGDKSLRCFDTDLFFNSDLSNVWDLGRLLKNGLGFSGKFWGDDEFKEGVLKVFRQEDIRDRDLDLGRVAVRGLKWDMLFG